MRNWSSLEVTVMSSPTRAGARPEEGRTEGGQVYNRMEEGSVQDSDTEGVPTGPPKHWTLELCARYRLAEFCFLLIVLIVGAQDSSFRIHKQQYVPQVTTVSSSGAVIVANNTQFSYPIRLEGHECSPVTLQLCIAGTLPSSTPCCAAMARRAPAGQTVPESLLLGLSVGLCLALLVLRHAVLLVVAKMSPQDSLRDALVGFLFTVAMTGFSTNLLKLLVAMPRPNHFALVLYGAYLNDAKGRGYESSAWKSFPSGHCSLSMCTLLYVSLLLLQDLRRGYVPLLPQLRAVLVSVALMPVYLALWVASTRCWDYWHSPVDAVGGMALGAAWTLLAFIHVIPENTVRVRPNAGLKYF